jgi:hypothetical protein
VSSGPASLERGSPHVKYPPEPVRDQPKPSPLQHDLDSFMAKGGYPFDYQSG